MDFSLLHCWNTVTSLMPILSKSILSPISEWNTRCLVAETLLRVRGWTAIGQFFSALRESSQFCMWMWNSKLESRKLYPREQERHWLAILQYLFLHFSLPLFPSQMYFYAGYVFREAGIPHDKIQYVIIGTGCCELITAVTCVSIYAQNRCILLTQENSADIQHPTNNNFPT